MKKVISEQMWQEMIAQDNFSGEVIFDEPMKKHTSLRIGGNADVLSSPQEVLSLKNMLVQLNKNKIPFCTVGGGTNLLVRDGGIDGVIVSLSNFRRIENIREIEGSEFVSFFVESGLPLQKLVSFAKENGYSGIEGLAGIPGSVGGAISGNAGSFGYEMRNILVTVTLIYPDGRLDTVSADALGFEYRASKIPDGAIILSTVIRLRRDIKEDISRRIEGFLKEKREKQPLSEWSAGCVFKNPEGTPAGKLIDEAGCKGMRTGDVEVSGLHANFFINKGNATAADFLKLMEDVRGKVLKVFGVELQPEIKIVGRENA